jgi:low temperature requirement protein LtrA
LEFPIRFSTTAQQPNRQWEREYGLLIESRYFHKGLLWRAQEAQEVASYELFIDLVYVAIIAISGDNSAEDATGEGVLRFAITFILAWKYWSDISVFISWFDADDIVRRITVLFVLTCLLGLTTNITAAFETTYTPLIAFYVTSRWFGSLYYLWMSSLIPMVRPAMLGSAVMTFLPGVLWIGSLFVSEPGRQALIWPAIFLDIFGPTILVSFERGGNWLGPQLSAWCKRTFEFIPGSNIEHKIERTNAFVALVFGYSVVSLLYQSSVPFGINGFFGKAVLGLIQAFAFNWLYFEVDTFNMHVHAIRRHFLSALVWLGVHLPFVMAFVLAGAALAKIVLLHDFQDADPDKLMEPYRSKSEGEIPVGLRWYYCAGLAIALATMGIISVTHTYREIPNQRCPKPYRLAIRFAVSLAILLLPLAGDRLDSLELVATTTCLVVIVLVVELLGNSSRRDFFWGFNSCDARKRKCTYAARCGVSKKDLEASFKNGEVVRVEELARKGGHGEVNEGYTM